ncbi:hypothetical protein DICPUDRAFT_77386 [Dictyostelium purpureum]|uniref:UspA domain-containing protein n=1 Tax=Dictyostelium purpureum TaxID=5786 RepID=F0ZGG4_DICPU|nr:uncharacterized protein DICPUDRAFT_77386 [Dictyostelium purpureum]EGC36953.1 hypothetical protein DICPUDRAFT_77386 [Dictyostelium purpureum]|eukprot:XP_003286521.1 hypothetical protein DICPUDRAFT_77386 [Dictyostelium purpureum]
MNRYMVCLDGSDLSDRAFSWVKELAECDESKKTEIFLFHVEEKKSDHKFKSLDEYSDMLNTKSIKNHKLLIKGKESIKDAIIKETENNKIDLVVLGHEDKNKLQRIMDGRGSVCEYLLKNMDTPLLIFK